MLDICLKAIDDENRLFMCVFKRLLGLLMMKLNVVRADQVFLDQKYLIFVHVVLRISCSSEDCYRQEASIRLTGGGETLNLINILHKRVPIRLQIACSHILQHFTGLLNPCPHQNSVHFHTHPICSHK